MVEDSGLMKPAAGYKFNSFQEIRSHSSILYNERVAILFFMLDTKSIEMNSNHSIDSILQVRAILKQIYKNIRMLIRFNPVIRNVMNLETKDEGIYTTDVIEGVIDRMIEYCEQTQFTEKRIYILVNELNHYEVLLKDVLQYYNYFIRPEFRQKPDVDIATEKYQEIADATTLEELRAVVGARNKIEFDKLGTSRIELKAPGELSNNEDEDDEDEDYGDNTDYIDSVNDREEQNHFGDNEKFD